MRPRPAAGPFARLLARMPSPFRSWRDRRGVAALEFALIAPILILMFFGIAELGQGLIAERRVSHATAALGDLAAQGSSIAQADADEMVAAARDILIPLPTTKLKMRVTSITGDSKGNPKVDWSYDYGIGVLADCATPPALPAGLVAAKGDTIILSESTYAFVSPVGYVLPNGLNFKRSSYLRPRAGLVTRTTPAQTSCG